MSVQVEKLEHNMAKLTIEVEASKFDAAMKNAYNKKKGSFNLPGFRKGKYLCISLKKNTEQEFFMKMQRTNLCQKHMQKH